MAFVPELLSAARYPGAICGMGYDSEVSHRAKRTTPLLSERVMKLPEPLSGAYILSIMARETPISSLFPARARSSSLPSRTLFAGLSTSMPMRRQRSHERRMTGRTAPGSGGSSS